MSRLGLLINFNLFKKINSWAIPIAAMSTLF